MTGRSTRSNGSGVPCRAVRITRLPRPCAKPISYKTLPLSSETSARTNAEPRMPSRIRGMMRSVVVELVGAFHLVDRFEHRAIRIEDLAERVLERHDREDGPRGDQLLCHVDDVPGQLSDVGRVLAEHVEGVDRQAPRVLRGKTAALPVEQHGARTAELGNAEDGLSRDARPVGRGIGAFPAGDEDRDVGFGDLLRRIELGDASAPSHPGGKSARGPGDAPAPHLSGDS